MPADSPPFREFYVNRYLTGSLLPAISKACFSTLRLLLAAPVFMILGMAVAVVPVWLVLALSEPGTHMAGPLRNWSLTDLIGLAFILLAGVAVASVFSRMLMRAWVAFFTVAHSRSYVLNGGRLEFAEGPPVFSGGVRRRGRNPGHPPDKLTIQSLTFDLNH